MVEPRREHHPRPSLFPLTPEIVGAVLSSPLEAFTGKDINTFFDPKADIFGNRSNDFLTRRIESKAVGITVIGIKTGKTNAGSQVGSNYLMGTFLGARLITEACRVTDAKVPVVRSGDIKAYHRERPLTPDIERMAFKLSVDVLEEIFERLAKYLFDADPSLYPVRNFFLESFPEDVEDAFPSGTYYPFLEGIRDVYFPVRKAFERMCKRGK